MTDEKAIQAARAVRAMLEREGLRGGRRNVEACAHTIEGAEHLVFMCEEIENMIELGHRGKAMRWLGFVQGALWARGDATIEKLKNINRPDEEVSS